MLRKWIAVIVAVLIVQPTLKVRAQEQQAPAAQSAKPADATPAVTKLPNDQLDSLVAPIALYPDSLLAQVLVASTYPLEIIQLQQWLAKNPNLKDKALADAVKKQDWDPSIQSMAAMPDVVKRLADDIKWTTDLGNAFLAQQSDVMDSVQRMRVKAKDQGNLKSTKEQKVETKAVEQTTDTTQVVQKKEVIVIEQTNPQVVYVPTYNPVVVYGPPVYPYPPIYYPPPGYYAAGMAISFGVGMAMGAAWGGGWCCGCGWGGNDIDINVDNDFNRNSNRNVNRERNSNRSTDRAGNRSGNAGGNKWSHNPQHRGAAPYGDRATSDRFGGGQNSRANAANRPTVASTNQGLSNRERAGNVNAGRQSQGAANRSAGGANAARAGGGDHVGNRSLSNSGSGNRGAFGGASSGIGGSGARASSSRGASSMSRGGGGMSRGGGGGRRR